MEDKLIEEPKESEKVTIEKKSNKGKTKINNKRLFLLLGIILVFFISLFCAIFMFFGSPKRIVKTYWTGTKEFDSAKVVSVMYDDFLSGYKKINKTEYKDLLDEQFEAYINNKCEILDININYEYRNLSKEEFNGYTDMLSQYYGIKKSKIRKARFYTARLKYPEDARTVKYKTERMVLVKIGFKWYAFPDPVESDE